MKIKEIPLDSYEDPMSILLHEILKEKSNGQNKIYILDHSEDEFWPYDNLIFVSDEPFTIEDVEKMYEEEDEDY